MTLQEIQDLAGHRDVPPWVVKLVGDALIKQRKEWEKEFAGMGEWACVHLLQEGHK